MLLKPRTPVPVLYAVYDHLGLRGSYETLREANGRADAVGGIVRKYVVEKKSRRKR